MFMIPMSSVVLSGYFSGVVSNYFFQVVILFLLDFMSLYSLCHRSIAFISSHYPESEDVHFAHSFISSNIVNKTEEV